MDRPNNIFFRLVRDEQTLTELLCNMLNYKIIKDIFFGVIFDKQIPNNIDYNNIHFPYPLYNKSIPDLAIINDDLECLIEIKVKIRTELTPNQPGGYLQYLNECAKKKKLLIFLIPKGYKYEEHIKTYIEENQNLKIEYWETFYEKLKDNEIYELNKIFKDFMDILEIFFLPKKISFSNHEIEYMFDQKNCENEKIYFNKEEITMSNNTNIPTIIMKLRDIIDEVNKILSINYCTKKRDAKDEYGIYFFKNSDNKIAQLYLGIWYPFWQAQDKPLCLAYHKSWIDNILKLKSKFDSDFKDSIIEYENYVCSWIDKDILLKDECIDDITNIVEKLLEVENI